MAHKNKQFIGSDDNIAVAQDELKRVLDLQWWTWRNLFLRAKGLIIEQRHNDQVNHQSTIDGLLANINSDDLATFESYYRLHLDHEIRSNTGNSELDPDPDKLEAQALDNLIRLTEGREHPNGLGLVPTKEGEYEIIPPEVDPRELPSKKKAKGKISPSGSGSSEMTPQRWIMIGVLLLGLLFYFIWQFAGSDPIEANAISTTPIVGLAFTPTPLEDNALGEDVTVFYPASLEIQRKNTSPLVLSVLSSASELGGTWKPDTSTGRAAWLNGTYINHVFCVPTSVKEDIRSLERGDKITMRPASGQTRSYEIVRTRTIGRQQTEIMDQRRAGLTLIVCSMGDAGNENNRLIAEAIYQPEQSAITKLNKGQEGLLSDLAKMTVQDITILPPDQTMPSGYSIAVINVIIENLTSVTLDANDILDQLQIDTVLAERLPPLNNEIDPQAKRLVSYRYYVPIQATSATWQAISVTGESIVYSITLPKAPINIVNSFSTSIDQTQIKLRNNGNDKNLVLLPVTVTANEDIELDNPIFSLWIGAKSQALTPQEPTPIKIKTGETKTFIVAAQISDVAQFEVQIGKQRWRITLP